jgi:hypothetical protein
MRESVEKLLSVNLRISALFVDPSIYRDLPEIGAMSSDFVTGMVSQGNSRPDSQSL